MRIKYRNAGFTLLEVLVALAVAAIALGALWKGLNQGVAVSQDLPDRVIARWVAQNRLVLRQALNQWPETRNYSGSESIAGREWYWREQIAATEDPALRRVTVRVAKDAGAPSLVTFEGFLLKPRPAVPQPAGAGRENNADDRLQENQS